MLERRSHPRIPLISIARLTRQGMESINDILVQNICTHGIGIQSQEEYHKGEFVLIHLTLSTNHHEVLDESVIGEVVWANPLPDGVHYAAGIRFYRMEEEKPNLYAHIKHLEGIS